MGWFDLDAHVGRGVPALLRILLEAGLEQLPEPGIQPRRECREIDTVATMVGALVLARAVDDPRLSDALREAALKHVISTGS